MLTAQAVTEQSTPLSEQVLVVVEPDVEVTQVLAMQSVFVAHLVAVLYEQ